MLGTVEGDRGRAARWADKDSYNSLAVAAVRGGKHHHQISGAPITQRTYVHYNVNVDALINNKKLISR